jgi:excisionase family DNA binding protein
MIQSNNDVLMVETPLFNAKEAADYLKITKRTLYNWSSQGKIKCIRLGGLKFDKEYLNKLIRDKQKENGLSRKKTFSEGA